MGPRNGRLWSLLALGIALVVFLALALRQLTLPGLYYDEALDLVPMLQVMHGEPVTLLRGIGLTAGNYTFPIMLLDYMGSLNGYLTLPFLLIFGPGVIAARLEPIFFSAISIVLAYGVARAWFGQGVARVTVLLLAVNPSFIWFSRQGISVTSAMTVFSLGSLLLLNQWRLAVSVPRLTSVSRFRTTHLPMLLAGILLGLGLWAKLLFLWWIVILAVMALVWVIFSSQGAQPSEPGDAYALRIRANLRANLRLILRALPWLAGGALIGAAPLIYYNLYALVQPPFDVRHAYTLGLLLNSLSRPTDYGVNNLDFATNLGKALADFNVFVDGSYFWYISGIPYSNIFAMPALTLAAVAGSALAFHERQWRKWLALLAGIGATVFISAFTVSGLWATHLFILLPLPQMMLAAASVWLASWIAQALTRRVQTPHRPAGHAVLVLSSVVVLLALPVSRDVWVSEQHHARLTETGGSGRFSDAVYKLASHLDLQHIDAPIALDWGIEKSVRLLTADRVRPQEIFGFTAQPDGAFDQRVRELLKNPGQQYIVLWDRFAVYNRRQAFTRIANEMGRQVTETFIAHERSGLPVYVMLQAQ